MNRTIAILALATTALLAGCTGIDPWGVFDPVPASPAETFQEDIEHPVEVEPAPDLAGRELTLAECVAVALEHNPQTAAAWQELRAAAARAGRAGADYLPSLGFSTGASRGRTVETDRDRDRGTRTRYEAVFGARWLLFDGGGRRARLDAAEAEVLAAGFLHNAALQDIAFSVEEAYYRAMAAGSFEEVAVETVAQREQHLRLAEARYEAGVVARSDVLRARAEKAAAELDLIQARNAVHVATGRLAHAMGLRASTPLRLAEPPPEDTGAEMQGVEALLEEAARNRPELKAALARVRSREADVELARSRYRPTVEVDARLGWAGSHLLPDRRLWNLGLGLDLPLFTGFDRNYQLHGSEAELGRATAERTSALRGVELEVWTTHWQLIEAGQAVRAAETLVESAEESLRAAEAEYRQGTGSIIALVDAQTARAVARNRLVQARLDRRSARARFDRAVGRSFADRTEPDAQEE